MEKIKNFHEIDRFLIKALFGYLKFFKHTLKDNDKENYYFEREWRGMGQVKFSIEDVERIFIPKKYAVRLRKDFHTVALIFQHLLALYANLQPDHL